MGGDPDGLMSYCQKENIIVEAYSPLAGGRLLNNFSIGKVAFSLLRVFCSLVVVVVFCSLVVVVVVVVLILTGWYFCVHMFLNFCFWCRFVWCLHNWLFEGDCR